MAKCQRADHEDRYPRCPGDRRRFPFAVALRDRAPASSNPTLATRSRRSTRRSRPSPAFIAAPPVQGAGALHARRAQVRADGGRSRSQDAQAACGAGERARARADRRGRACSSAATGIGASQALDRVLTELSARRARAADRAPDGLLPRRRAEPAQPHLARAAATGTRRVPGYSYVLGMHAFGLEEMNQYPEAEATARARARDAAAGRLGGARRRPRHGDAGPHRRGHRVPAVARAATGRPTTASRSTTSGTSRCSSWTAAGYEHALALYDASIHPEPAPYLLSLVDATALLWRLPLEGRGRRRPLRARRRRLGSAARPRSRASTRSTTRTPRWRSWRPGATASSRA